MPKTPTLDQTGLDELDPENAESRDASHFRELVAAAAAVRQSDERLHRAVARARQAGDSWTVIGSALGMTRQGAYQRFGRGA